MKERTKLALWAALTLSVVAPLADAVAAPAVRVVYVPISPLDEEAKAFTARIDEVLLTELSDRKRVYMMQHKSDGSDGTTDVLAAANPQHDDWVSEAARQESGGRVDAAVATLQKYIMDVERRPYSANLGLLGRARLALAAAQFKRGKEDEGQKALDELVRLRPDLEVPVSSYPPLFVRLHAKALQKARDSASASLTIEAPDGAVVTLNGRSVSIAGFVDVPAGTHYVAMTAAGKQIVRTVTLRSKDNKTVTFGAASAAGLLAQNRFDKRTKRALGAIADAEGAPYAVSGVAAVVGDSVLVRLVFVASTGLGAPLGEFSIDKDLLSATVEASKMADKVTAAVDSAPTAPDLVPLLAGVKLAGEPALLSYFGPGTLAAPQIVSLNAPSTPNKRPVLGGSDAGAPNEIAPAAKGQTVFVPPPPPDTADEEETRYRRIIAAPDTPGANRSTTYAVSKPAYKQWWLWTIVGAVVVGAGVATGLVLTAKVGDVAVNAEWQR